MLRLPVSGLPVRIGRIVGSPVAECSGTPLVTQYPDILGCEVEKGRCNSRALHFILASCCHVGPVLKKTKVHRAISAVVDSAAVHKVLSFIWDISEVLERCPVVHRKCKRRVCSGNPLRRCWQIAVLCCDGHRSGGHHQVERSSEGHFG